MIEDGIAAQALGICATKLKSEALIVAIANSTKGCLRLIKMFLPTDTIIPSIRHSVKSGLIYIRNCLCWFPSLNLLSWGLVTRRQMLKFSGLTVAAAALDALAQQPPPADYTIDIAAYELEVAAHRTIRTIAYNRQVPGPLLRLKEGRPVTIDVTNQTGNSEVVHWHGLFLPPAVDGAMEEGTPMIPAGGRARYTFTPRPAGFRWYHTHVFAGKDLHKGQYTGEHGFLLIEPRDNPARYDQEIFLALHDWDGQLLASGDGAMDPVYEVSTINGRVLGFGEPLRVRSGEQILLHILNSSPSEVHWIALAGHQFKVIELDGNPVPQPQVGAYASPGAR